LGGLLTGLTIILIVATLTPIIKLVPIPLISAIVAFSAFFNVADFSQITLCYKYHRKDFVMFLVTFLLSLLLPLADALLLSAVISLLWILKRSSKPTWFLKQFDIDQNN
jgi:MFS superfamily sulfate permease-like transporter